MEGEHDPQVDTADEVAEIMPIEHEQDEVADEEIHHGHKVSVSDFTPANMSPLGIESDGSLCYTPVSSVGDDAIFESGQFTMPRALTANKPEPTPDKASVPFSTERVPLEHRSALNLLPITTLEEDGMPRRSNPGLLTHGFPWKIAFAKVRKGSPVMLVRGMRLGRESAIALIDALCSVTTIERLTFRDVTFKNESAIIIAKGLPRLPSRLQELIFDQSPLTVAEHTILLQNIRRIPTIQRLALHDVTAGPHLADDIMNLDALLRLTHLSLENMQLSHAWLIPRVAALIQFLPELTTLRLVNLCFQAADIAPILSAVAQTSVTSLDVRYNLLHGMARHMEAILAVARDSAVETLNMEYCRLPEAVGTALATCLEGLGDETALKEVFLVKGNATGFVGKWRKARLKTALL